LTAHGVFSLERDVLQRRGRPALYGMPCAAPFLDIGIPEDLARANNVLEAK
jgi:NDP-sugar pyrophosphorylase family protein